ncbi:MAG: c-type cytochrome [Devosia nanyangense]|uniref:C-type cytochrome n=1 Tax=Devosia nanyangense TaxID=1228055 RepID=A0A933L4Z7_9HYPH|nr:c-type cytochrome [Devosia nanyangense]
MRHATVAIGAVIVAAIAATLATSIWAQQSHVRGRELYVANCAPCHGASLEGQPDWMKRKPDGRLPAPPHDTSGHTWHHSDAQIFLITKEGLSAIAPGYESDMPTFGGKLKDTEIIEVLEYIKSTWPDRERAYQAARSAE